MRTVIDGPALVLVGPIPVAVQNYAVDAGGRSVTARDLVAAKALLETLNGTAARDILKVKGMESQWQRRGAAEDEGIGLRVMRRASACNSPCRQSSKMQLSCETAFQPALPDKTFL